VVVRARFCTPGGEAQQLFDGVGDAARIVAQPGARRRMLGQQTGAAGQHAGGGVVAAGDHGEGEAEDARRRHGVVAEARQVGDDVVGGLAATALDQRAEVGHQLADGAEVGAGGAAGGGLGGGLGPAVEVAVILGRHAEIVGDDQPGQRFEEVGDDVDRVLGARRFEPLDDEGAHRRLDARHLARGQVLRHQAAELGVHRRVEEHHRHGAGEPGGGELVVGDRQALGGGEGGGVAGRRPHVGETGQHPEVAVGDAMDRRALTQRGVHRKRVAPGLAAAQLEHTINRQDAKPWRLGGRLRQTRSMMVAMPMPMPMHMVARP
jgi:hypothetical protein